MTAEEMRQSNLSVGPSVTIDGRLVCPVALNGELVGAYIDLIYLSKEQCERLGIRITPKIYCRTCGDELPGGVHSGYRCGACAQSENRESARADYYASHAAPGDDWGDVDENDNEE